MKELKTWDGAEIAPGEHYWLYDWENGGGNVIADNYAALVAYAKEKLIAGKFLPDPGCPLVDWYSEPLQAGAAYWYIPDGQVYLKCAGLLIDRENMEYQEDEREIFNYMVELSTRKQNA